MSKNIDRNLDIISNIDEDIIDKNTEKRIKYINRSKKKKFIPIIAIAAALALIMGAMLAIFIPMLTAKQAPIYTGMTVSSADGSQVARVDGVVSLSSIISLDNENTGGNNENNGANNKKPIKDMLGDLIDVGDGEKIYYAKPGETIRITVHFDNPDQYEILSFTINGAKYGSHMFLEGSDMEALTVNYTIDESAEGVTECTIDAIKYVDGTTIKDVKIGGDKTIKIGIYSENQPNAKIENEVFGTTDISFDVSVDDPLGFVSLTGGKLRAVLAEGENIIKTCDLSVGKNQNVKFEGLDPNKYYRYAVVAIYDAFDGNGMTAHILFEAPLNVYSIQYDLGEGENPEGNPTEYSFAEGATIKDPVNNMYIFSGWTYEGQKTPVRDLVIPAGMRGDLVLTANWKNPFDEMVFPVNGGTASVLYTNTQFYNPSTQDYRSHQFLEISANQGSTFVSMVEGTVLDIYNMSSAYKEKSIAIGTAGDEVAGFIIIYSNISSVSADLKVGDKVEAGTTLGTIKTSLHVQMLIYEGKDAKGNDKYTTCDPMQYFSQDIVDSLKFGRYFGDIGAAPVKGNVIKKYGESHRGIDIAASVNEEVRAITTSVIEDIKNDPNNGYSITLKFVWADFGAEMLVTYHNLDEISDRLKVGDAVEAGDLLGKVGAISDSACSKETHLHLTFEYCEGLYIDPQKWIEPNSFNNAE